MATNVLKFVPCPRHLLTLYKTERCLHTQGFPLLIHLSSVLRGEPPRKQKKNPMLQSLPKAQKRLRQHLEKRKKTLEKFDPLEKPVEEIHVSQQFIDECEGLRKRPDVELSEEEIKNRNDVLLEFFKLRCKSRAYELKSMKQLVHYQDLALQELRKESEDLYQSAIQLDEISLPFQFTGPTETPPIHNYQSPDGEYDDISKKF